MMERRGLLTAGLAMLSLPLICGAAPKKSAKPAATSNCVDVELCAERQSQAGLPRSPDPLWSLLRQCKVSENQKTGMYAIVATPEVKALAGKIVRAKGFTLPLDGNDRTNHFLIGVNTPVCFYHPPGQPNEVIEVISKSPVVWDEKMTTIEGTFSLINNGEMGVFFKLTNARQVRG
ncbi:hypothetical protein MMA231_03616 (plasmid) [Asticcacaulis sp. MM231]|uniref:DUF3299 domain-containing protein n=1 Tax=Asticcacaulis sp. MM231 TaxID=3157666 RepID=UPI0032D57398